VGEDKLEVLRGIEPELEVGKRGLVLSGPVPVPVPVEDVVAMVLVHGNEG
jgi:hypothetical protein